MLRKSMIVFTMAAALTAGASADAFARGGGGHFGGGHFGGGHMSMGFASPHLGAADRGFSAHFAGDRFAGTHGHFRRGRDRLGLGLWGDQCSYNYPGNPYNCYSSVY